MGRFPMIHDRRHRSLAAAATSTTWTSCANFCETKPKEFLKDLFSENAVRDSIEGTEVYRHAVLGEPLMFPPEPDDARELHSTLYPAAVFFKDRKREMR